MDKYFFLGEFGFLQTSVLGCLERLTKPIEIYTYPDYLVLMQKVSRYVKSPEIKVDIKHQDVGRMIFNVDNPALYDKLQSLGAKPLKELVPALAPENCESYCDLPVVPISKPLTTNYYVPYGKYISVACRKRQLQPFRNAAEEKWKKVLQGLPEYTVIFHGLRKEVFELSRFAKYSRTCSTIEEAIAYLNKSICFIGSALSGYCQFASNCNCNVLQLNWGEDWTVQYNPFSKILSNPLEPEDILSQIKDITNGKL